MIFQPIIFWATISMAIVMLLFLGYLILRASENKDRKKVERDPRPSLRDDPDRKRRQDARRHRERLERVASRPTADRGDSSLMLPRLLTRADQEKSYESEREYVPAPAYQTQGMMNAGQITDAHRAIAQARAQKAAASSAQGLPQLHMTTFTTTPPPSEYDWIEAEVEVLRVADTRTGKVTHIRCNNGTLTTIQGDWGPPGRRICEVQRWMVEKKT